MRKSAGILRQKASLVGNWSGLWATGKVKIRFSYSLMVAINCSCDAACVIVMAPLSSGAILHITKVREYGYIYQPVSAG